MSQNETLTQHLSQIDAEMKEFIISDEQMKQMKQIFMDEMKLGFSNKVDHNGSLLMMNSYITRELDSNQTGDYLSLDLGSTNFRVCHLKFVEGSKGDSFHVKYYDIPPSYRVGPAAPLFNHIAGCIKNFVETEIPNYDHKTELPLGFTFSFPMTQKSINCALLNTWTKSYDIPEVVNQNPTKFLQDAIDALSLNVKVVALINDSTGTLVKGLYLDPRCKVGVIMGTGFNICYTETDVNRMEKWKQERLAKYPNVKNVMIDIECGAFGDNGSIDFVKTDIDKEIDANSLFPKSFSYEKLFAGKFLGSIAQLKLRNLANKKLIFNNHLTKELLTPDNFPTKYISHIEAEDSGDWVRLAFEHLGYPNYTSVDEYALKQISKHLSVRTAQFVSVAISAVLEWIGGPDTVVAIDGSLYKHHPKVDTLMRNYISSLLSKGKKFDLILAEDGSGKGAGLVASIAKHL